jgi:hypothetical protein
MALAFWKHKDERGRSAKRAPVMPKRTRGGIEEGRQKLLGQVVTEREAEEIGAAGVRVFFVPRRNGDGLLEKNVPRSVFGEQFLLTSLLATDFNDLALGAATDFEEDSNGLRGVERTRRVVVGERSEQCGDFGKVGGEAVPRVSEPVVDDRAGEEDLLNTSRVLARDTHDHVCKFGEAEDLPDDRTHADVASVFVGVANGDLVGKWHGIGPGCAAT